MALYILSVALVRSFRWTGVTRYGSHKCPDFPPGFAFGYAGQARHQR